MSQTLETIFSARPLAHHAYGIETQSLLISDIRAFFDREDFSYVFDQHYGTFKIDDARSIRSLQSEKTERGSIFILGFDRITTEAENALLKVLEEPTADTYFILLFPYAKNLLPTLQSRLSVHSFEKEGGRDMSENPLGSYDTFQKMNLKERFDHIQSLVKAKDSKLEKSHVLELLNQAEDSVSTNKPMDTNRIKEILFLKKSLASSSSPSVKMILDHLAIITPMTHS